MAALTRDEAQAIVIRDGLPTDRYESALSCFNKAPEDIWLGHAHYSLKNYSAALLHYNNVFSVRRVRVWPPTYERHAHCLLAASQPIPALQQLRRAIPHTPSKAQKLKIHAWCLSIYLYHARHLIVNDISFIKTHSTMLMRSKNTELTYYGLLARAEAGLLAGWTWEAKKSIDAAKNAHAASTLAGPGRIRYYSMLAQCELALGRVDRASDAARTIKDTAIGHLLLSAICRAKGDMIAAKLHAFHTLHMCESRLYHLVGDKQTPKNETPILAPADSQESTLIALLNQDDAVSVGEIYASAKLECAKILWSRYESTALKWLRQINDALPTSVSTEDEEKSDSSDSDDDVLAKDLGKKHKLTLSSPSSSLRDISGRSTTQPEVLYSPPAVKFVSLSRTEEQQSLSSSSSSSSTTSSFSTARDTAPSLSSSSVKSVGDRLCASVSSSPPVTGMDCLLAATRVDCLSASPFSSSSSSSFAATGNVDSRRASPFLTGIRDRPAPTLAASASCSASSSGGGGKPVGPGVAPGKKLPWSRGKLSWTDEELDFGKIYVNDEPRSLPKLAITFHERVRACLVLAELLYPTQPVQANKYTKLALHEEKKDCVTQAARIAKKIPGTSPQVPFDELKCWDMELWWLAPKFPLYVGSAPIARANWMRARAQYRAKKPIWMDYMYATTAGQCELIANVEAQKRKLYWYTLSLQALANGYTEGDEIISDVEDSICWRSPSSLSGEGRRAALEAKKAIAKDHRKTVEEQEEEEKADQSDSTSDNEKEGKSEAAIDSDALAHAYALGIRPGQRGVVKRKKPDKEEKEEKNTHSDSDGSTESDDEVAKKVPKVKRPHYLWQYVRTYLAKHALPYKKLVEDVKDKLTKLRGDAEEHVRRWLRGYRGKLEELDPIVKEWLAKQGVTKDVIDSLSTDSELSRAQRKKKPVERGPPDFVQLKERVEAKRKEMKMKPRGLDNYLGLPRSYVSWLGAWKRTPALLEIEEVLQKWLKGEVMEKTTEKETRCIKRAKTSDTRESKAPLHGVEPLAACEATVSSASSASSTSSVSSLPSLTPVQALEVAIPAVSSSPVVASQVSMEAIGVSPLSLLSHSSCDSPGYGSFPPGSLSSSPSPIIERGGFEPVGVSPIAEANKRCAFDQEGDKKLKDLLDHLSLSAYEPRFRSANITYLRLSLTPANRLEFFGLLRDSIFTNTSEGLSTDLNNIWKIQAHFLSEQQK